MISSKQKTISFYTLGCRLNQSETAVIERTFNEGRFRVVDFEKPADIVVINTCTVTENGDADTRRLVNKVNRLNPDARIALIGCQAQVQKEKLAQLKNVSWIIGNERKMDLRSILDEVKNPVTAHVIAPTISRTNFTIPTPGVDRHHTRANIKIQDGCDFFCSFCEIPYARGRARSRVFDDILLESRALATAGHKEIVLTGINLGTYSDSNKTILHVIDELEKIPELKRIRISSIEPTTIPFELIERMTEDSKLCRYLHIPLQSANNKVLQLMKRKYAYEEFAEFITRAHNAIKDICIGTDVIVGFPGEEEDEFNDTFLKLKELPIDYFHVFSYSQRQMAKSQHFAEANSSADIQTRSQILRNLSTRKRRMYFESLLGTTQNVLFEHKTGKFYNGLTDTYVRVYVKTEEDLTNQIRAVQFKEINGAKVLANLIS